jgi:hypothetical protein
MALHGKELADQIAGIIADNAGQAMLDNAEDYEVPFIFDWKAEGDKVLFNFHNGTGVLVTVTVIE